MAITDEGVSRQSGDAVTKGLGMRTEDRAYQGYLYVEDLRCLFRVGESKARLMMDALPSVRIGNKDAILRSELDAYIAEHGGIRVKWPKRRR